MKTKVMTGEDREKQLIDTAVALAKKHGAANLTRRMIAKACDCSEALVSNYLGTTEQLRRKAKNAAKKAGVALPDKKAEVQLGKELRAHGPRDKRDTRKRSPREVEAIKRKGVPARVRNRVAAVDRGGSKAPPLPVAPGPTEFKPTAPAERKTAARAPKLPPIQPVTPSAVD